MAELRWTAEALDWIEEIYRYIAQDNPVAAAHFIERIQSALVLGSSLSIVTTIELKWCVRSG